MKDAWNDPYAVAGCLIVVLVGLSVAVSIYGVAWALGAKWWPLW